MVEAGSNPSSFDKVAGRIEKSHHSDEDWTCRLLPSFRLPSQWICLSTCSHAACLPTCVRLPAQLHFLHVAYLYIPSDFECVPLFSKVSSIWFRAQPVTTSLKVILNLDNFSVTYSCIRTTAFWGLSAIVCGLLHVASTLVAWVCYVAVCQLVKKPRRGDEEQIITIGCHPHLKFVTASQESHIKLLWKNSK